MLMRENKGFFSFAFDSVYAKNGFWPGPKSCLGIWENYVIFSKILHGYNHNNNESKKLHEYMSQSSYYSFVRIAVLIALQYKFTMVYCESVNVIASFTVFYLHAERRQLWTAIENRLLEHVMLVSHLSAHRAQCLKPLNCRCKRNKTCFS